MENFAEVKKTFEIGGFYRVDVTDRLSILTLNTLFYNKKNSVTDQMAGELQLDWLAHQLNEVSSPPRKFLLQMHIPNSARYESH